MFEVDAPGNRWTFERKGIFRQRIEIRSVGTGGEPAIFHYQSAGGRLEYADGRVFFWKQGDFWATPNGDPIVGFQTGGALQMNAEISIDPDQDSEKAPSLLIFLGWYLINMSNQDDTVAIASVISG
ncbi:MAG: hypothetical protein SGI73_14880 [Chloroflexota bacterium]|nr:hypothetical protein [Chloroflexota bacterium]